MLTPLAEFLMTRVRWMSDKVAVKHVLGEVLVTTFWSSCRWWVV